MLLLLSLQVLMCTGIQQTVDYYLCPGENGTQMCSTNHIYLEWSVTVSTVWHSSLHETRSIPHLDQNIAVSPILMNSANFTFSRTSSPGVLPLVSTMTINNVTSNLEGTMIRCTGLNSSSVSSVVLMTTIHVYDLNDFPNTPEVVIRSDMTYFRNNFTVTLEWLQYSHETYSIAIVPEPLHTGIITNTSVQLGMLYNTLYNVKVTATLCGHRNATDFTIHYGECDYPTPSDDVVTILSHTEGPWLQGYTVNYSCASGLKVTETNSSTCMDNGQWEPDPSDITCTAICGPPSPPHNGYIHSYSNKSLRVIVVCREGYINSEERLHIADCHLNGTWQPNPTNLCDIDSDNESQPSPEIKQTTCNCNTFMTALISSVSSSFFFFAVGIICGLICGLITKLMWKKIKTKPQHCENSPDYEIVQPPINLSSIANKKRTPKEVTLQQNEAYSPL